MTHRRSVSRWVKQWAHAVGMDTGNYSAHSLRKTFAYQLWLEQGKTDEALVIVSKALGHKNTGVTMDYIGIPSAHHRRIRTTNRLEWLFRELKNRLRIELSSFRLQSKRFQSLGLHIR